jgi:pilus assembly protein CpaB
MGVLVSVSLVAAISLALVARGIASSHDRPVAAIPAPVEKPMVRVLVAKHDLAPGDKLTAADFTWQPWPAEGLNPAFVTDGAAPSAASSKAPATVKIETAAVNAAAEKAHEMMSGGQGGAAAKFVDAIVRDPILQGEPIIQGKVVHSGAAGVLAVTLDPGMRAMAVPLSAESAAGGFILPGDHVDVVQSRQIDSPSGGKKFASGSVLQNVKVMAIDQSTHAEKGASVIGATATLEVTPAQAELLALSKAEGELTLILRSYADIAGSASAGAGPHMSADAAQAAPDVVKVFRNGAPSVVAVAR